MKKAFTLSEALITVAIVGVMAGVVLPIMNNAKPDKDKIIYKKALYNMQSAVSSAMESDIYSNAVNSSAYWNDPNLTGADFCQAVGESLNTKGNISCSTTSSYENPNFVTTDGIRYWGLEQDFRADDTKTIYVDRNLNGGDKNARDKARKKLNDSTTGNGLKIDITYDGRVLTPEPNETNNYHYENDLIFNSFNVTNSSEES